MEEILKTLATKSEVLAVRDDVLAVMNDVQAVKSDVLAVKHDVQAVKNDVLEIRTDLHTLERGVDERFDSMDRKMKEYFEESKRFMGMLHEDMRHQFKTALEILEPLAPRVTSYELRIQALEEDVAILKVEVRARR